MNKILMNQILIFTIIILFVFLSFTSMAIGKTYDVKIEDDYFENIEYMSYDGYNNINFDDFRDANKIEIIDGSKSFDKSISKNTFQILPLDDLLGSPWSMKCHDNRHTSLSTYSTADNPFNEVWKFRSDHIEGGPIIGEDGILYFGDFDRNLYAVNPDGTEKWRYETGGWIWSTPAIDENGTVYVGSYDAWLYAVNPDGILKWRFPAGASITSSPAIGVDGTIYFGTMSGGSGYRIWAVNPDGTEKWHYQTGYHVTSDPAIADDGTIYIGSGDDYLYAINPNGTLKWRFKTGDIIKGPASIADDGTIYVGSADDFLYALYSNGTLKWKYDVDYGTESNPSIGYDGTIYCGGGYLYAINPDGTEKWTFDFGGDKHSHQSSPAISSDGTIFIGIKIGDGDSGEIVAVNPDGTERWRKLIATWHVQSSPCIGEDGTVYIGSSSYVEGKAYSYGYLYAFNELNPDAPDAPSITGETNGEAGEEYEYTFSANDPNGDDVYYYIEWGYKEDKVTVGPYPSGEEITLSYSWPDDRERPYIIIARAEDTDSNWGPVGELTVSMPLNQQVQSQNSWFLQFLQNHPNMFPRLHNILNLN